MTKPAKNTICLWYDRDAEEAARFYAKTFPDSSVGAAAGSERQYVIPSMQSTVKQRRKGMDIASN